MKRSSGKWTPSCWFACPVPSSRHSAARGVGFPRALVHNRTTWQRRGGLGLGAARPEAEMSRARGPHRAAGGARVVLPCRAVLARVVAS